MSTYTRRVGRPCLSRGGAYLTRCKSRRWQKRQIRMGLCSKCNDLSVDGKTLCQRHLNYHKEYRRAAKARNPNGQPLRGVQEGTRDNQRAELDLE